MRIDIITIFPQYLEPLRLSVIGKAIERGTVDLNVHDLRDFTHDRHRTVDDTPFGGGPGMVMKPEPWGEALDAALSNRQTDQRPTLVLPTPSGQRFDQPMAADLAATDWLIFACGRYEGIDARVVEHFREQVDVRELSIGDYVLAGGEAAVLVMAEATIRLLPGVLGNADSAPDDSFSPTREGAPLEGPIYTKPQVWRGLEVPAVLRSGDHGAVADWRRAQSVQRTSEQRPDLAQDDLG